MKTLNFFFLLTISLSSFAEETSQNHLAVFLENMQTLQANFKQTLVDDQGVELDSTSGEVFLHRPNKFRWDYQHPYVQTIMTNGETLWFYDEDLEQVTISDVSQSMENTPVAILSSIEEVEKQFVIIEMGNIEGFNWVELTPRDIDSQYNSIRLGFDQKKLGMMLMFDNLDQVTRIDFTEEVLNQKLADDKFNFSVPEGIDVIDDRVQLDSSSPDIPNI